MLLTYGIRLSIAQDYDLSAVYMRNWDTRDEFANDKGCEWEKDWEDVQRVCKQLDIPCELVLALDILFLQIINDLRPRLIYPSNTGTVFSSPRCATGKREYLPILMYGVTSMFAFRPNHFHDTYNFKRNQIWRAIREATWKLTERLVRYWFASLGMLLLLP